MTENECRNILEAEDDTPCPEHCVDYYDGCGVTCSCPGGDTGLFMCFSVTPCSQFSDSEIIPRCNECQDEDTMEYTMCGSCDATCDNPNPNCDPTEICVEKCQC